MIDAGAIVDPDLGTVDALARWQLRLQRRGATLRARNVSAELQGLLELAGLADVVARPIERPERADTGNEPD